MKSFMIDLFGQKSQFENKAQQFVEHFLTEFPKALRELKLALEFTKRHYGYQNYSFINPVRYCKSGARGPELESLQQTLKSYEGITQDTPYQKYRDAAKHVLGDFVQYLTNPDGGWEPSSSNVYLLCSFYHYWLGFPHSDDQVLQSIKEVYGMLSENHESLTQIIQETFHKLSRQSTETTNSTHPQALPKVPPSSVFLASLLQHVIPGPQQPMLMATADPNRHPMLYQQSSTHTIQMRNDTASEDSVEIMKTDKPKSK